MEFSVKLDDEDQHWVTCASRAVVSISVRWRPAEEFTDPQGPHCLLSYLTAPGSQSTGLPDTIALQPDPASPGLWTGHASFEALPISPLRIRVELRPAFQRPQVIVLHVIPKISAWFASGLVAVSLGIAAVLLAMTLATLRITMTQAATQLSSIALLGAALYVLRRALAALRPDHLPFLGVTFLIHRSLLACSIGFVLLFTVLQSCFVTIHNDTGAQVALSLPWLDGETKIAPKARISVIPPTVEALRDDLLAFLAPGETGLPLCVEDGEDPSRQEIPCINGRSRETPSLGQRLEGWFSPPRLSIRCGRRWVGLSRDQVFGDPDLVLFEGEQVWITPDPAACGQRPVELWYRHEDGGVHHVRYPWQPNELTRAARLFTARVTPHGWESQSRPVTLVARREAKGAATAEEWGGAETRIALGGGATDEGRGFALRSGVRRDNELVLGIGDSLPQLTSSLAAAATLKCEHSPSESTVFQVTQLAIEGPNSWLSELTARSPHGLAWSSTWVLTNGTSPAVASPWICEVLPGEDPRHTKQVAFAPGEMKLLIDESAEGRAGRVIVAPARLLARHLQIDLKRLGKADPERVGTLDCGLRAGEDDLIAVGAVDFDDQRDGVVRSFTLRNEEGEEIRWRAASEGPSKGHQGTPWLCWRVGVEASSTVTVTADERLYENSTWNIEEARLTLPPIGTVTCYLGRSQTPIYKLPPGSRRIGRALRGDEVSKQIPAFRRCHTVYEIEERK
ncbi:MAG: hypothetical protein H6711_04205 [Myxococcales bacterium]|nr:hypothetical protein [Myxococcales bacterium]